MSGVKFCVILFLFISIAVHGQVSLERQALNNLHKGKWEKCRLQVQKVLRKDSLNIPARYVLSLYFFTPSNPAFQIDSSYKHIIRAITDYAELSPRQLDKYRRFPIDSMILVRHRQRVDSAAFVRAMQVNTEAAYISFIERFTSAEQLGRARELRDEVAYIDALKLNTYQAFYSYLERYPQASRAAEARERYEKLLFETKTKDQRLKSFELFLQEHPETPYRLQAEQQIFELSTASGSVGSLMQFIERYPGSIWVKQAKDIAYHLLKEQEEEIPAVLMNDSLINLRNMEQGYLVPFYKDGLIGFMDASGNEVIPPVASELNEAYLCGNITEELLVTDKAILARNGAVVYPGEVDELEDLDYGFILVSDQDCTHLIHKSGFTIARCIDDARVLAGSLLGVKQNGTWSIRTFSGRLLPIGEFEAVDDAGEILIVKQAGQIQLIRAEEAVLSLDQQQPNFSEALDETARWNDRLLWVRKDSLQGIWDNQLKERVKLEKQTIIRIQEHALLKTEKGMALWNEFSGRSDYYQDIQSHSQWITARNESGWVMLDDSFKPYGKKVFDSTHFTGPFLMGIRHDSTIVFINRGSAVQVPPRAAVQFLPGRDAGYFLMLEEGDKKTIYNSAGERLFTVNYDRVEYAGENLFMVVRKEKRGLINLQGKIVVPMEYDAMGNITHGTVPVLKDKKFGYLDVMSKKEIKPAYEKNILRYNQQYLIATRKGLNGLIDWNNKPVTGFDYEEIQFWNDSAALVKKNFQWIIYNFIEKKVVVDNVQSFRWLRNEAEEKIIIINRENNFGVISNRKGTVLSATFSEIINLGSSVQPFYFTEKHVEEASIYVVIYYDASGRLVRRQVFESDDYDRIYCRHK